MLWMRGQLDRGGHGFASKKSKAIWQDDDGRPLGGQADQRVFGHPSSPRSHRVGGLATKRLWHELVTTRTAWLMARMLTLDVQEVPNAETLEFYKRCGMERDMYEKRARPPL